MQSPIDSEFTAERLPFSTQAMKEYRKVRITKLAFHKRARRSVHCAAGISAIVAQLVAAIEIH